MATKPPNKPYDVGYKKPPKGGRFKPGQSGNPRGPRPRHGKAGEAFSDDLDRLLPVTVEGRRRKMPVRAVLMQKAIKAGLAGDFGPLMKLQKIVSATEAANERRERAKVVAMSERDTAVPFNFSMTQIIWLLRDLGVVHEDRFGCFVRPATLDTLTHVFADQALPSAANTVDLLRSEHFWIREPGDD